MFFRSRKTPFLILVMVALLLALTHTLWLSAIGAYLVQAEQPAQADFAVVLAGDYYGRRVLEAADLARRGLVRKVLIDGSGFCYGVAECDLALRYALSKGYPAESLIAFPMAATSTRREAELVIPELRRLGARSFLLVTSDYHTRRAGKYFRRLAGDLDMRVIAAPDEHFRWNSWWRDREAQKIVYMEWSKTVASWFGI